MSQITDRTLLETVPANNDLLVIRDVSDTTDKPTGTDKKITLQKLMEAAPGNIDHFLEASREPNADDDSTSLFEVGSLWYVETGASAGGLFFCIDASEGAAVWVNLTSFDVSTAASLTVATDGLQLLGDEESPGPGKVYGTDGAGAKGWRDPFVSDAQQSIEAATDGLRLVGDQASPGNDKVYGTGPAGARGWYDAGWRPSQAVRNSLAMVAGFSLPPGATALGTQAIAIQASRTTDDLTASGDFSIAIGTDSKALEESVAIGLEAEALGAEAVAIGFGAVAGGDESVAIGEGAASPGEEGAALGNGADALIAHSVAVGRSAYADDSHDAGDGPVAIGDAAYADGDEAVAIGASAYAEFARATALGNGAYCDGVDSSAIGPGTSVSGNAKQATALGYFSDVLHDRGVAANGGATHFAGHVSIPGLPAALPANQSRAGDDLIGDHGKWVGDNVSILSDSVDLTVTGDVVIDLPAGVQFFPDECGVIILDADTGISQAQISFGTGVATSDELVNNGATTGLDAPGKRERFQNLNTDHGQTTLSAHVTSAGSGTTYTARFYWRGFAVCDE